MATAMTNQTQGSDICCGRLEEDGFELVLRSLGRSHYAPRGPDFAVHALEVLRAQRKRWLAVRAYDQALVWRSSEIVEVEAITNATGGGTSGELLYLQAQDFLLDARFSLPADSLGEIMRRWYWRAAALGSPSAALELGVLEHFSGRVPLSTCRHHAAVLYRRALQARSLEGRSDPSLVSYIAAQMLRHVGGH
mmetsp:Transcript_84486/g.272337  ORF Transcript_84486/g.272337 Transcript_84486/m.272337 type:complete len:193 (-) Transcript_84486:13-591(-)